MTGLQARLAGLASTSAHRGLEHRCLEHRCLEHRGLEHRCLEHSRTGSAEVSARSGGAGRPERRRAP